VPPTEAEAAAEAPAEEQPATEPAPEPAARPVADAPEIEAVEIPVDVARAARLRAILEAPPTTPTPSEPPAEIPRPKGRAPRMVSLTLLDGTTLNLPAKRRAREREPGTPSAPAVSSQPPGPEEMQALTARDLILALRVVAHGADASEVLGSNERWESLFSALLSLLLKKHLIADWEFVDELKKTL
jgi:hypothetical protein